MVREVFWCLDPDKKKLPKRTMSVSAAPSAKYLPFQSTNAACGDTHVRIPNLNSNYLC
jgi:hypothetical protein